MTAVLARRSFATSFPHPIHRLALGVDLSMVLSLRAGARKCMEAHVQGLREEIHCALSFVSRFHLSEDGIYNDENLRSLVDFT